MRVTPRAKLLLLAALFLAPIVASSVTYLLARRGETSNYGELLLPPAQAPAQALAGPAGKPFKLTDLEGKWILVATDSGACEAACRAKLATMRQVRIALGRRAQRVERVLVVDDLRAPAGDSEDLQGMVVAVTPAGTVLPPGAGRDRGHIYLVDPHGNVMMRWPAAPDAKRMLRDLERLLRASQIG